MQFWVAMLCVLIAANAHAVSFPGRLPDDSELPSLAPMLEQIAPAIVNITTSAQTPGSGVIVDARQGYVVTNNHVIDGAKAITVTLADGRELTAKLVGTDPPDDLAVLKVNATDLTQIAPADSRRLRVGDFVVAVGKPFGPYQTVTAGIVSALGRSGPEIEGYEDFIQTSAAINAGNSGGALVNLRGDLVGINTAIPGPAGNTVGVGLAIPSDMVSAIMTQLIKHGAAQRGTLGIRVQALNAELARTFNVEAADGVVVVEVGKESAAARAGMVPGDVIVKLNDRDIKRVIDFHRQSALLMVGDTVNLTVLRAGKEKPLAFDITD